MPPLARFSKPARLPKQATILHRDGQVGKRFAFEQQMVIHCIVATRKAIYRNGNRFHGMEYFQYAGSFFAVIDHDANWNLCCVQQ